jgi:ATP-citrate lyase beta-subunit
MARVKLTEYRAKKILLGTAYRGVSVPGDKLPTKGRWVAKVDQGVKKRMKQGLVAVDVSPMEALRCIARWKKKDFSQFLLEPFIPHQANEEQYLSFERVRNGVRVLHAKGGGIDIETHPESVATHLLRSPDDVAAVAKATGVPPEFLSNVMRTFGDAHVAFLEMNPLVVRGATALLLDAAALVDSTASFFARGIWSEGDIVKARTRHPAEARVEALASTTPAVLKLDVLNKNGSLFFLLSGGGGSIVVADEAALCGAQHVIGNYGEYSGGPTREETHLYAREVVKLLLASKAKRKALVIAGGVANFTDVAKTFAGIIDALGESVKKLKVQKVKVFVRRGGPNEREGLRLMEAFLKEHGLFGSVYGSDTVITKAVDDAIRFLKVPAPLERIRRKSPSMRTL